MHTATILVSGGCKSPGYLVLGHCLRRDMLSDRCLPPVYGFIFMVHRVASRDTLLVLLSVVPVLQILVRTLVPVTIGSELGVLSSLDF